MKGKYICKYCSEAKPRKKFEAMGKNAKGMRIGVCRLCSHKKEVNTSGMTRVKSNRK